MREPWLEVTETEVVCNRMPVELVRSAMCEWLERHGIDPNVVCVPGRIVRNEVERRVYYLAYERDEDGNVKYDIDAKDACRVLTHVQLEGLPLPWPRIVALHIGSSRESA